MQTILIVDDEMPIVRLLQAYLDRADYRTEYCTDGEEALIKFAHVKPALVLLDINLPGLDGWEVLGEIRSQSACPVIMLTARGDVQDRLRGLQQGADDYIPKPFDPAEVVARVQAVLRRPPTLVESEVVRIGSLSVDLNARQVTLGITPLTLAPRDFDLLEFLAKHPNQTFSRDQLLDRVWGIDFEGSDRAVDVAIKRLRQSLADWPPTEGEIVTIRGLGYALRA
jgi:DNA-binding response OmpR family regulator